MSDDLNLDLETGEGTPQQNPGENQLPPNTKMKNTTKEKAPSNDDLLKEVAQLRKKLAEKEIPSQDINAVVAAAVEKALREREAANPKPAEPTGQDMADDYDEEGKYYFSYRYATALTGYMFNGKPCDNPMATVDPETKKPGATTFLYMGHKTSKVGGDIREAESIVLCHYCSRSKAEQRWIENHPEYRGGIIFTDVRRATGATAIAASRAAIAARILNSVSLWTAPKVAAQAKTYGVDVTTDVESMRIQIVEKMVDAEIAVSEGLSQRIVKDASKDALFESKDPNLSASTPKTHANA